MKKLDEWWGVSTWIETVGDDTTIRRTQDCQAIIDNNVAQANEHDGFSPSRELMAYARIPIVVYEQWLAEDVARGAPPFNTLPKDEKTAYLRKRLADPDNRKFIVRKSQQPYQRIPVLGKVS